MFLRAQQHSHSWPFARATHRRKGSPCPCGNISPQGLALARFLNIGNVPLNCPTRQVAWSNRRQPSASLHGVVFDILAALSRGPRKGA